jgi:hypothetical protein
MVRCCWRPRGGHGEGAGQGGEGRGAPKRRVDGEAAQTASGGDVRWWGGGSGGWRQWVWGPAAPESQGGEKIVRKSRGWQLGEEFTGEWRTAAVLGRNPRGRVGYRWLEAAVQVRGAVGRLRRSRGGVYSRSTGSTGISPSAGGGAADRRTRGERGHGCAAARARVGRPEKKRGRAARMHSKVLYLFELV